MPALETAVVTRDLMGTVASVRIVHRGAVLSAHAAAAIDTLLNELEAIEAVFSTFIPASDVSRIRRGELALADAHPLVRQVAAQCETAETLTGGRFFAGRGTAFDPTGYVKGWAVERAAASCLAPLLAAKTGVVAAGVGVGGDLRVMTAPREDWTWGIGVADPHRRGATIASFRLRDGAVATSGVAERGDHIHDPRTGRAAAGRVASATVIAPTLTEADLWATAAVVAGFGSLGWAIEAPDCSGMLVADDGRVRRFAHGVEVSIAAA